MGRLEQIEKRDRFVTLTTPRHKDSFTAEDREWLIARARELEDTLLLAYDALNHKELPSYCVFALKSIRPLLCDEAVAKLERQSSH